MKLWIIGGSVIRQALQSGSLRLKSHSVPYLHSFSILIKNVYATIVREP